jgi:bleomycin hydrolase
MKTNQLFIKLLLPALLLISACSNGQENMQPTAKPQSNYQFTVLREVPTLPVINQHASGTCWAFSTTSFLESEIIRIKGERIDLSEMFFVRDAYIIKSQNYIMRQGAARFSEGGLNHDPVITMAQFGLAPQSTYTGLIKGDTIYDHRKLFPKLEELVKAYAKPEDKKGTKWKVKLPNLLDDHMGKKPGEFTYQNQTYTPMSFLAYTKLNPKDYLNITSFSHTPFYQPFILNIAANWLNESYYNLPLDEYIANIDHAIETGYSLALDLDISESTFSYSQGIAVLPDKPGDAKISLTNIRPEQTVTQEMRQTKFEEFYTTDDHNMHIIGRAKDQNGNIYYKVKNSWGPAAGRQGFFYISVAYMRAKSISVLLHKDGLAQATKQKLNLL